MDNSFITGHWYASVYEQYENQTDDVEFLLKVLKENEVGKESEILEVACGGGRICIPLAEAGYNVTGFDSDVYMLTRCYKRMNGLPNIRVYHADATDSDWGGGYDAVVMAGNLLINIEADMDYVQAQRLLIKKASDALKSGGYLYLDFDLHSNPKSAFSRLSESHYFEGSDELGTSGKTVSYGSVYDPITQICAGCGHWSLTTVNGQNITVARQWYKHIPTQAQVYRWLSDSGLIIKRTYFNYTDRPLSDPLEPSTYRATILGSKI